MCERAGISKEADMPLEGRPLELLVPHGVAGSHGCPSPTDDILDRQIERHLRCALQRRDRGGRSVQRQPSDAVDQQVEGRGRLLIPEAP